MPQLLTHVEQRDVAGKQQAGEGVPKVVRDEAGQLGGPQHLLKEITVPAFISLGSQFSRSNEYEKSVALALDQHSKVLWWYRNLVGHEQFAIQGYRRNPVYPDFVVQKGDAKSKKPIPQVLVVESKGKQLKGSEDTKYKRELAKIFENIGQKVTWQELGEGFRDRTFRFQILDEGEYQDTDWHDQLKGVLNS